MNSSTLSSKGPDQEIFIFSMSMILIFWTRIVKSAHTIYLTG